MNGATMAALFGNSQMASGMMMGKAMASGNKQAETDATRLAVATGGMSATEGFMMNQMSANGNMNPLMMAAVTDNNEMAKGMMIESSGMLNGMGSIGQMVVLDKLGNDKPKPKNQGGAGDLFKYELLNQAGGGGGSNLFGNNFLG